VIYYASQEELYQHSLSWHVERISALASVALASEGTVTLGVATGPSSAVAEQLLQKTKVVQAMHERVQFCQDAQTEFMLARQSLGVSRVNHIFRVHGHSLALSRAVAQKFDDIGEASLERLFPGITHEGHEQAALAVGQSGLGWRKILDVALPAHLAALLSSTPRIKSMIEDASTACLASSDKLKARLVQWTDTAKSAFLNSLDELEKVRAEDCLIKVERAAETAWLRLVGGAPGQEENAPEVEIDGVSGEDDGQGPAVRRKRLTAVHAQKELTKLVDRTKARRVRGPLFRTAVPGSSSSD